MATVTCKYHTQLPARWTCNHCHINYCPSCVKPVKTGNIPACPVCKQVLDSAGTGNMIKPFWSKLRDFFLYPFHVNPLIIMLSLSLVAFVIAQIPGWNRGVDLLFWRIPQNLFFLMPFMFVFFKYAHSVLEDTAHGYIKPTELTSEKLMSNGLIVFKMFMLYLFFQLLEFASLDLFGRTGEQVMIFVSSFVFPAAIMVLMMEDKFFSAFNPELIFSVIIRIGTPYLILTVLFYFLFQFAFNQTLGFLFKYIGPESFAPVLAFVSMYFMLIAFNMMGYLLYQHHEELGFEIDVEAHEHEENIKADPVMVSPELRMVEILIQEGKTEEAIQQLQNVIQNSPSDLEARDRLLKLLRLTGDMPKYRTQGQDYISYLFHENKISPAADIFQSCYEYDKTFRPAKAVERLELARFLKQNARNRLAMAVLNNLHVDFPSYDGVPQAYLMVAQLLCEQFNEDEQAKNVLRFVIKNYASSPLIGEVKDYLGVVDRLHGGAIS